MAPPDAHNISVIPNKITAIPNNIIFILEITLFNVTIFNPVIPPNIIKTININNLPFIPHFNIVHNNMCYYIYCNIIPIANDKNNVYLLKKLIIINSKFIKSFKK